MDCKTFLEFLHPWVDGELDLIHSLDMERHLESCSSCFSEYTALKDLQSRLSQTAPAFNAPEALLHRVQAALKSGIPHPPPSPVKPLAEPPRPQGRSRDAFRAWIGMAGVGAVVILILVWGTLIFKPHSVQGGFLDEVVTCHLRSLQATHLLDVASTDQHTVKPWFAGKLDFSPPVVDLSKDGFPLIGGRLDYLGNHAVAAMVYRRNLHIINLFCLRDTDAGKPGDSFLTKQGYHVFVWRGNDFQWIAVSDLNAAELQKFTELLRRNP